MMLNVRCDNVFLLGESLLLSVEQRPANRARSTLAATSLWSMGMMRKTAWIWFLGFAAWLVDSLLSLRLHNVLHARLALMVAIVFFTAGLFYRRQT